MNTQTLVGYNALFKSMRNGAQDIDNVYVLFLTTRE